MTMGANQYRKPGRPATRKDKNGRPMLVRGDRDRLMKWLFEYVGSRPDLTTCCNSAQMKDSLDSTTHSATTRTGIPRQERSAAGLAFRCRIWSMYGVSTTGYWEPCIWRRTCGRSWRMSFTMREAEMLCVRVVTG